MVALWMKLLAKEVASRNKLGRRGVAGNSRDHDNGTPSITNAILDAGLERTCDYAEAVRSEQIASVFAVEA
jgi:hypothetical protein